MKKGFKLVSVLLTVILLMSVHALAFATPEISAAVPDHRFRDTSEKISIRPTNISWDGKNDPYAVRIKWDLAKVEEESSTFFVEGTSPIPYNYAALYWTTDANDKKIQLKDFTVVYGSKMAGKDWDEPVATSGTTHPLSESLNGEFLAPFHAIMDGSARDTFAVSISGPEGVVLRSVTLILAHHFGEINTQDAKNQSNQAGTNSVDVNTAVVNISAAGSSVLSARPTIIPRASWWGSLPANELNSPRWPPAYSNITHAIIHHTGSAPHNNQPTPAVAADWVRSIWRWHATAASGGHNWGDIGYNFIVDRFGNIYHGRHNPRLDGSPPQDVIGGHARGFNTGTMGIAFLGLFNAGLPSSAALSSTEQLLAWRFRLRGLDPLGQAVINNRMLFRIAGHRDTGAITACPGNHITNYLPTMRNNVALRMR